MPPIGGFKKFFNLVQLSLELQMHVSICQEGLHMQKLIYIPRDAFWWEYSRIEGRGISRDKNHIFFSGEWKVVNYIE